MSTTPPKLHQFMVYAPDKTDEGAFQRRLSVRAKHLEAAGRLSSAGKIKIGGALLTPESLVPNTDKKLVGSMMIFEAETIEEVKKIIKDDIYYTSDVWDPERIVVLPFAAAPM